ncbi:MAG: M28 family peptidase [Kiritimatiellae bacterium]|nr:M28 family peptidase [Kiritimatiellia bacterium]
MLPAALLAASLSFAAPDADIAFSTAKELVVKYTPRNAGTFRGRFAAGFILRELSSRGVNARMDRFSASTPNGEKHFHNVIAEWETVPDGEWVAILSHFDTKTGVECPGANDGASTSGLLVALAAMLERTKPSGLNIMLAWLDGEECMHSYSAADGFWGSRHAAAKLKASGRKVKAVICLDMLGDKDLGISIPANSTPGLVSAALRAAAKAGAGGKVRKIPEYVKDDHLPFLQLGFPAIDLIDFEYGSAPGLNDYWHTKDDTIEHISADSLLVAGGIVTELLKELQK